MARLRLVRPYDQDLGPLAHVQLIATCRVASATALAHRAGRLRPERLDICARDGPVRDRHREREPGARRQALGPKKWEEDKQVGGTYG